MAPRYFLLLLLSLLPAFGPAAEPQTTQPLVLETYPPRDSRDVDPDLTHIRVRFNQPMDTSSWSWCGGGPLYPEVTASPSFQDEYTALLPVRLASLHTYMLRVNCPSAQGFRSLSGTAVPSTRLVFTTGYRPGDLVTTDSRNRAAADQFWLLFSTRYAYFETFQIPWQDKFRQARPWLLASRNPDQFAIRLVLFLEDADDPHLRVIFPDGSVEPTHRRQASYNGNQNALLAAFPGLKKHNDLVWSAEHNGIGYLAINSWSAEAGELDVAQSALNDLLHTRALILDVRANGGGSETEARRIAARFVDQPILYARHRLRDPAEPGGYTSLRERWLHPDRSALAYRNPVFVLMGPVCLSSNESFLKMMQGAPRATLLGDTSGGSSANPRRWPLPNGVQLSMAQWEDYLADGTLLERRGIQPDVKVTGDFSRQDPVLAKALDLIDKQ